MLPRFNSSLRVTMLFSHYHYRPLLACSFSTSSKSTTPTTTESTNSRVFFEFQKENSTLTVDPKVALGPPLPPKNFQQEYKRRPMYGYALKGDMSYKEVNWWIIQVVAGSVLLQALIVGWYFYKVKYITPPEETQRKREATNFFRYHNPETAAFRNELHPLIDGTEMLRFIRFPEDGNIKEGEDLSQSHDEVWSPNRDDINDASQIIRRQESGRKGLYKKEAAKMLADFDAELR